MLVVAAGFWLAAERSASVAGPVLQRPSGAIWIEGRVLEAEQRDAGHRMLLDQLVIGGLNEPATPQRVRITLPRDGAALWPGDRIRIRAMLSPPPEPAMPGGFDFAHCAWFRQIGAVGYANGIQLVHVAATRGRRPWVQPRGHGETLRDLPEENSRHRL